MLKSRLLYVLFVLLVACQQDPIISAPTTTAVFETAVSPPSAPSSPALSPSHTQPHTNTSESTTSWPTGQWIKANLHPRNLPENYTFTISENGQLSLPNCHSTYEILAANKVYISNSANCTKFHPLLPTGFYDYAFDNNKTITFSQTFAIIEPTIDDTKTIWVNDENNYSLTFSQSRDVTIGEQCAGQHEGWFSMAGSEGTILLGWVECQGGLQSPVHPGYYDVVEKGNSITLSRTFIRSDMQACVQAPCE